MLHYGPKVTTRIETRLEFEAEGGTNWYEQRLAHAEDDTLFFEDETLKYLKQGSADPQMLTLGAGHRETRLVNQADLGNATAKVFRHLLTNCRVYHFHDTSTTARVRQSGYIGDSKPLLPDAGNLAAFLYRLKNYNEVREYQRIVSTVRMIAPFSLTFISILATQARQT